MKNNSLLKGIAVLGGGYLATKLLSKKASTLTGGIAYEQTVQDNAEISDEELVYNAIKQSSRIRNLLKANEEKTNAACIGIPENESETIAQKIYIYSDCSIIIDDNCKKLLNGDANTKILIDTNKVKSFEFKLSKDVEYLDANDFKFPEILDLSGSEFEIQGYLTSEWFDYPLSRYVYTGGDMVHYITKVGSQYQYDIQFSSVYLAWVSSPENFTNYIEAAQQSVITGTDNIVIDISAVKSRLISRKIYSITNGITVAGKTITLNFGEVLKNTSTITSVIVKRNDAPITIADEQQEFKNTVRFILSNGGFYLL